MIRVASIATKHTAPPSQVKFKGHPLNSEGVNQPEGPLMGKRLVIPSFAFKAISGSRGTVASRAVKGVRLVRRLAEPCQPSNKDPPRESLNGRNLSEGTVLGFCRIVSFRRQRTVRIEDFLQRHSTVNRLEDDNNPSVRRTTESKDKG